MDVFLIQMKVKDVTLLNKQKWIKQMHTYALILFPKYDSSYWQYTLEHVVRKNIVNEHDYSFLYEVTLEQISSILALFKIYTIYPCAMVFQYIDMERTWWWLIRKQVAPVCTKLYICIFTYCALLNIWCAYCYDHTIY